MNREKGFYWVKYEDVWEVMEWAGNGIGWLQCGISLDTKSIRDRDLESINENIIINPGRAMH